MSHEIGVSNFIREIGTHLQVLRLDHTFDTIASELLPALVNIEELSLFPVYGFSDEMMELIFVEPLPYLQKRTILQMKSSKRLSIVANSVTDLREFECCFGPGLGNY